MNGRRASSWMILVLSHLAVAVPNMAMSQPGSDSIAQWIDQLGDDCFAVREAATGRLIRTGKRAIEPVAKAALSDDPEVTDRAVRVLYELTKSSDGPTAEAARAALTKLVTSSHGAAKQARRAVFTLQLNVVRRIEDAGGSVSFDEQRITTVDLDKVKELATVLPLLGEFPELENLSLSNKGMDDKLMAELRNLPKLKDLNLYQSSIGDAALKHLRTFPALRRVPMGETRVTDAGLVHLKELTHLEYIGLRADDITDAGLEHLKDLTNLTGLHLGETKVTDAGLVHLKGMQKLTTLYLTEKTKVTAAGVAKLQQALPHVHVSIRDSEKSGKR